MADQLPANNACVAVLRTAPDGVTHIRFTRPGIPGEFHLSFRVEHTPPFGAQT